MSRYQNLITEILDAIFEGHTVDEKGKLEVVNEQAAKTAADKIHTLVLEKSRDLWDQLEAAEGSLKELADEISFEEMNTDPSSIDASLSGAPAIEEPEATAAVPADAVGGVGAAAPLETPAIESANSLSDLLGAEDFNLDDIFKKEKVEEHGMGNVSQMQHLDNKDADMPFDEHYGEMPMRGYENEGNEDDYNDLEIGMAGDENGEPEMGMEPEMDMDNGDMDNGDMDNGDMDNGDLEIGMDDGFDFDLDLEGFDSENDEEEEYAEEGMMGGKSYRMEGKGDNNDDNDNDKDDDDKKDDNDKDDDDKKDDNDKPAFLKKDKDED